MEYLYHQKRFLLLPLSLSLSGGGKNNASTLIFKRNTRTQHITCGRTPPCSEKHKRTHTHIIATRRVRKNEPARYVGRNELFLLHNYDARAKK
jgi:hypothetical protein